VKKKLLQELSSRTQQKKNLLKGRL